MMRPAYVAPARWAVAPFRTERPDLWRNCLWAYAPFIGNADIVSGDKMLPISGSPNTRAITDRGLATSINADMLAGSKAVFDGYSYITVAMRLRLPSTSEQSLFSNINTTTGAAANGAFNLAAHYGAFYSYVHGGGYQYYAYTPAFTAGIWYTVVFTTYDKNIAIYAFADESAPLTGTGGAYYLHGAKITGTAPMCVGGEITSTPNAVFDMSWAAAWAGTWSDARIRELGRDPFALFRKRPVVVAAPSTSTVVSLSGAAISISNASGALSVPMPLSGGATATVTGSGSMTVHVPLSADAVAKAVASGQIKNMVPLTGAADASANASGTLSVVDPLSGAATADATGSATMHVKIALSGAAVAKAIAAGTLSVAGALSGHATASSTASGTLTQKIPLQSSALIVTHASGNLTERIPLSGAALIASKAQGVLHLVAPMSASAVAKAAAQGTLALHISMSGDAVAQAKASGALSIAQLEPAPDLSVQSPPRNFTARDTRLFTARDDRRIRAA